MPYTPSLIQTILSVPESHRFLRPKPLADYTAGGESHPAPKTNMRLFSTCMVARRAQEVKRKIPLLALYRGASILYNGRRKRVRRMPAKQMTVCFSGYRPEKLPWGYDEDDPRCAALKERLRQAVTDACEQGYRHFICGMARGVDTYCGEITLALRAQYPEITLEAAIPCPSQPEGWTPEQQARWQALVERCDYETVVQDHYSAGCMQRRNRYMVDHAQRLIAVFDGQEGGTRRTVEYAMRRGLEIVYVDME